MNDLERLKRAEEAEPMGVLVMEMPENCWLCPICLAGEEDAPAFGVCWRAGKLVWNPDYKPNWCPLQPAIGIIEPNGHVVYLREDD